MTSLYHILICEAHKSNDSTHTEEAHTLSTYVRNQQLTFCPASWETFWGPSSISGYKRAFVRNMYIISWDSNEVIQRLFIINILSSRQTNTNIYNKIDTLPISLITRKKWFKDADIRKTIGCLDS